MSVFSITPDLALAFSRFAQTVAQWNENGGGLLAEIPAEDAELRALWVESLSDSLREDCRVIVGITRRRGFGKHTVHLSEAEVDAILRSCASARLKIYESHLKTLPESALEQGEIKAEGLSEVQQVAYAVYAFMANLQEVLLSVDDPEEENEG